MPATRIAPSARYPAVMIFLHWAVALLILAALILAWTTPEDEEGARAAQWMIDLHRSLGLTVLAGVALRLLARGSLGAPPAEKTGNAVQQFLSRATHGLLYVVMIAMPLSGYLFSTAKGDGVPVFGVLTVPAVFAGGETFRDIAWGFHTTGQLALYGLVGLHLLGVLYHQYVRRDGVAARMVPGLKPARVTLPAGE